MKKVLVMLCCILMATVSLPARSETGVNRFAQGLEAAGLKLEDFKWDPSMLARVDDADPFRLYWYNELWSNPIRVPRIANQMSQRISLWGQREGNEINIYFFYGVSRTVGYVAAFFNDYLPPLQIRDKDPLTNAIRDIHLSHRLPWSAEIEKKYLTAEKELDVQTAILLAKYVLSVEHLYQERTKVFEKNCPDQSMFDRLLDPGFMDTTDFYRLGKDYDQKQMMYAICRAVFTIQEIKNTIRAGNFKMPGKPGKFDTPFGEIIIDGSETANTYTGTNSCLIIDAKGDDRYFGAQGATSSFENCSSVVIDIEGNDIYLNKEKKQCFGAGILGLGIVADLAGNDIYESVDNTQGAGIMGVGLLIDYAGNDSRKSMYMCQGAGTFGVGVLVDFDGKDVNECYGYGQGYGYTRGFGLMYDKNGDDVYIANDTDIISPSAQNPKHNTSMAQGVGNGRRADFLDGKSMSGGCGMLIDDQGNDTYSCGVFGQGTAYWFGVGILNDKSGNDTYKGLWYVQGTTAHFAISEFKDDSGDDHYYTYQATSLGTGHDFSCSWHIDTGGNDIYDCWRDENGQKLWGGLMIGCGNETGFGLFLNLGGDDTYNAQSDNMFGGAYIASGTYPDGVRNEMLCLGYFIDIGGNDTYQKDFCKQNDKWLRINPDRPKIQVGIGMDIEDGSVMIIGIDQ
jgi:hypothetical protein